MGKTVRIIQIIILTVGVLASAFFIGLHMKTGGNADTTVNAADKPKVVSEAERR